MTTKKYLRSRHYKETLKQGDSSTTDADVATYKAFEKVDDDLKELDASFKNTCLPQSCQYPSYSQSVIESKVNYPDPDKVSSTRLVNDYF